MRHLLATTLVCCVLAPACLAADTAWTGTWVLDRSRPEPDGAADDYRFTVTQAGAITWEIPSLHEVNTGRMDGTPMAINRPGGKPGLALSVWQEAPRVLRYKVALNGQDRGEGRMTLSQDGSSWTDVPLDIRDGKPAESLLMVYKKR